MSEGGSSSGTPFEDGKADGAMRTIGEVSAAFGIKPHVLRYWEQNFPSLTPLKRSGGRRLYRSADVAMVQTIDRLVNREGYTLKGARKAIASGTATERSKDAPAKVGSGELDEVSDSMSAAQIATQLRAIRDRLAAALQP